MIGSTSSLLGTAFLLVAHVTPPGPGAATMALHPLVIISETLVEKQLPEAAGAIVRLGLTASGMAQTERARLYLVNAMLLAGVNEEPAARTAIADALSLDRAVMFHAGASLRLKGLLEDARASRSRTPASAPSSEAAVRDPPATSLVKAVDELYKSLQLEGVNVVLQLSQQYEPFSPEDQAQLMLRRGCLKMEMFEEAVARHAFQEALRLDRTVKLPEYVPPKTLRIFEELRMALPPLEAKKRQPPPPETKPAKPKGDGINTSGMRSWSWAPAAGGVVLGAASGVLYWQARAHYDRLITYDPSIGSVEQLQEIAGTGRTLQTTSFVLLGAGAAALTSAAAMYVLGGQGELQASVQVSPGTISFGIAGVLP